MKMLHESHRRRAGRLTYAPGAASRCSPHAAARYSTGTSSGVPAVLRRIVSSISRFSAVMTEMPWR